MVQALTASTAPADELDIRFQVALPSQPSGLSSGPCPPGPGVCMWGQAMPFRGTVTARWTVTRTRIVGSGSSARVFQLPVIRSCDEVENLVRFPQGILED